MKNLTIDELKLIAEKRGIKIYRNMSRKKLIRALEQIARMNNLPRNKLEQIAKKRGIKEYTNMLKEGLLVSLLKSGQSIDELHKSNYNNAEIKKN